MEASNFDRGSCEVEISRNWHRLAGIYSNPHNMGDLLVVPNPIGNHICSPWRIHVLTEKHTPKEATGERLSFDSDPLDYFPE